MLAQCSLSGHAHCSCSNSNSTAQLSLLLLLLLLPSVGSSDIMVPEEDVALQGQRIPTAVRINYDRWSHMDFTW